MSRQFPKSRRSLDLQVVETLTAAIRLGAPREQAAAAAGIGLLKTGAKLYGATKVLDGGRINPGTTADYAGQDPTAAPGSTSNSRQRTGGGLGRIITDMGDGKEESLRGPTLRSPYHQ